VVTNFDCEICNVFQMCLPYRDELRYTVPSLVINCIIYYNCIGGKRITVAIIGSAKNNTRPLAIF